MLRSLTAFLAATTAAFPQSPTAPIERLDPVTVTAHPAGTDERPASVWVVHAGSSRSGTASLANLLLAVPGLHLDQPGGAGGRSTLYLRGGEENHALIFLDGIPLNDPTNNRGGAVDLSILEPAAVRSAAVVRGPASVRHGPEALSGTVHFGTTTGARDTVDLQAETGGNGFRRAAASVVKQGGGSAPSLDLAAFTGRDGSLAGGSRIERRFLRGTCTIELPVRIRLSAWHSRLEADGFPDDSGGSRLAVLRQLEQRGNEQTAAALAVEIPAGTGRLSLTADTARFLSQVTSPGVAPGARDPYGLPSSFDDTRLRRDRACAAYEGRLGAWEFAAGIDAQREAGRSRSTLQYGPMVLPGSFAAERSRAGFFAETSGAAGALTALLGARSDRYGDGRTRGTVRAGMLGALTQRTALRLNAGTGFKPASFYALSNPLVGNPALRPERARTIDAGIRHTFADRRGLIDLTVFASRFLDGIDFDPGPPARLVNRGEIRSRGAEAAAAWQPSSTLSLGSSLTFTDARSRPGDQRMRSRPRWRGGLSATWKPVPHLSLTSSLACVGSIPDTSVPTGDVRLGGGCRVDLAALWHTSGTVALTLALDNALDGSIEAAVGFPSPGRRLRAGLRASF